jgi:hypothetical protein
MRRRIYLALPNGGVVGLYRLTRTANGLFVVGTMAKAGAGQHLSYQEDGVCFDHSGGQRARGRRRPLTGNRGAVTLVLTHLMLYQVDAGDITSLDQVRAGDILIDRPGVIGIEIILSDYLEELPVRPDRPNVDLHFIPMAPQLLVEVFDAPGDLGPPRYPDDANWEPPILRQPGGEDQLSR